MPLIITEPTVVWCCKHFAVNLKQKWDIPDQSLTSVHVAKYRKLCTCHKRVLYDRTSLSSIRNRQSTIIVVHTSPTCQYSPL